MSYLLLFILTAMALALILAKPLWREYQRRQIKRQPFTKMWRKILQQRMPYFRTMPTDLQLQLKDLIQVFIAEKNFIGKAGQEITDEIKVTIAAQACLLLLNRKTDIYPNLHTILVYPAGFIKQQQLVDQAGVQDTVSTQLIGESWQTGNVVLSWRDTVQGAQVPDDGSNLVIHEFAHQLDQESGSANGAPILGKEQNYQDWSRVMSQEFNKLQQQVQHGQSSLFDQYGATNPAEFFAVASEVFFEQAQQFQHNFPELYQQFSLYYKVDPRHW